METEQCEATKKSPTAEGDVEVRCTKASGHVEAGDERHEGKVGAFPVRWHVVHYNPGWVEQVTSCGKHFVDDLPASAVAAPGRGSEQTTCPECRYWAGFDGD